MSNARSPREVCSTTMGTSGLMLSLCFACSGRILQANLRALRARRAPQPPVRPAWPGQSSNGFSAASRRPDLLGGGFLLLLVRRPELVARLCLLDRDRLRVLHEQVDRLAHRDVLAQ